MNLYQINQEQEYWLNIYANNCIDMETGERYEELYVKDKLDAIEINKRDKIKGYAFYVKNKKSDLDQIELEEKRLKERKEKLKSQIETATNVIKNEMNLYEFDKLEYPEITLSLRKSKKLNITNEPEFFDWARAYKHNDLYNIKTEIKPDKDKIKKFLKEETCPYAVIEENKNLVIK